VRRKVSIHAGRISVNDFSAATCSPSLIKLRSSILDNRLDGNIFSLFGGILAYTLIDVWYCSFTHSN